MSGFNPLSAPNTILVGDLRKTAAPARDLIEPLRRNVPNSVAFVIGPEGDFAPPELDALAAAGAQFVDLGPSTLRTETAALYAISLLRYAFR